MYALRAFFGGFFMCIGSFLIIASLISLHGCVQNHVQSQTEAANGQR